MAGYKNINGVWHTCGCGGTPRQPVRLEPGTALRVFNVPVARYEKGKATGRRYLIKPHMIAVDIDQRDVEGFGDLSRAPTDTEQRNMAGYTARQ